MTLVSVRPESGRLTFPRFSNLFDNILETEFPSITRSEMFKTPALVNIKEVKDSYIIEVAAPGFTKENFSIKVEGNMLAISGNQSETTENTAEKFTRKEFSFSSFTRNFTLPKTVEAGKITATYENGILLVTLPKKEEAKENGTIEVKIS